MSKKKKKKKKPKYTSGGRTAISGHTQQGSKLIPPMAALPNVQLQSWKNERLPEMLWAGLLFSQLEQRSAIKLAAQGINLLGQKRVEAENSGIENPVIGGGDVTHTGLSKMEQSLLQEFLNALMPDEEARLIFRPLLLLDTLPARHAWAENIDMRPETDDWRSLMKAVAVTLNHQSQEATDCRFLRVMAASMGGALHLMRDTVNEFVQYPNVDLKKVRPTIRATEGALNMGREKTVWPEEFWNQCLRDTPCWPLNVESSSPGMPPIGTTIARVQDVRVLLIEHCNTMRTSTAVDARFDNVFGVGLYALSILEELLRMGTSNTIMARFALRSLVDNLISLAYLAHKNDPELWKSFRVYGAGQAKLQYLKLDSDSEKPSYINLDTLQNLANEDMWEEFLQIELGHWDKSNTRLMSEEAGIKNIYDRFYGWTSTYLHGHWAAIRDSVFDTCGNPLHRLHRIPRNSAISLPDVIPDATFCVDEILRIVSTCYPDFPHRVTIK